MLSTNILFLPGPVNEWFYRHCRHSLADCKVAPLGTASSLPWELQGRSRKVPFLTPGLASTGALGFGAVESLTARMHMSIEDGGQGGRIVPGHELVAEVDNLITFASELWGYTHRQDQFKNNASITPSKCSFISHDPQLDSSVRVPRPSEL